MERPSLIRRSGTADLFPLPLHFLPQQQPQSFGRATSITAELLLPACIKGRICRTKRSVSLQIHQSFSQMRRNFTWNSAWRSVLLCFLPVQELPGHSYGEASKTSSCAQLTPESKTGMSSGLHLYIKIARGVSPHTLCLLKVQRKYRKFIKSLQSQEIK